MSVQCIVGFCLSMVCLFSIFSALGKSEARDIFIYVALVSGIAGMIISSAGAIKAASNKMDGIGFGIAGIVMPVSGVIIIIVMMFLGEFSLPWSLINAGYEGTEVKKDAWDFVLDGSEKTARSAMIWNWYWDGDPEHTVIEIPDEYSDGIKIRSIGERKSAYTKFFRVKLEEGFDGVFLTGVLKEVDGIPYSETTTEEGVENDHVKDLVFTVKVGKNIDKDIITRSTYYKLQNKDGSVVYYKVVLNYEVDPENPKFYSSEGKLYYKDTDKEVSMKNP